MDNEKTVRQPKQKRSIQMKEKILSAAMQLICDMGFFETTTNEIAKAAGISIGSLYSYFSDKDTILAELLERHHQHFMSVFEVLSTEMNVQLYSENLHEWLRRLVMKLIDLHLTVKDFNRALSLSLIHIFSRTVHRICGKRINPTETSAGHQNTICTSIL